MKIVMSLVGVLMFNLSVLSAANVHVVTDVSFDLFQDLFCAVQPKSPTTFVMSSDFFKNHKDRYMTCSNQRYIIRYELPKAIDPKDPRHHAIYNIESPDATDRAFDCDAKADKAMNQVGLNCFPVD